MSWSERLQTLRAGAERRLPVLTELIDRLMSGQLLDSATRLAAQAFLASVPLLFAVAAFAPHGMQTQLQESVRAMFGLTGPADGQLRQVIDPSGNGELRETTGIIGLLVVLGSATSFSRAMVRVCERAWGLPKASSRITAWRWVVWLLALVLFVFLQGPIRGGLGAGAVVGIPLYFALSSAVWLWTQRLLLASRIDWLPLLPGALLAGAATSALALSARVYMPLALNRALNEYGSLGLVLAMLSWLIVLCTAVTFALTVGAVLAQAPPLNRYLMRERQPDPA
ncbi:YhjD/YihY/BrkB family envelope integrity protein [Streptomyces sp. NPDC050418]|uniref:YhjD/YihY/BrkB family envelope integrity protein n=1 Tax=Streptomyces sp. NPDC050418 TaxID=3365612 RepID=UPI0037A6E3FD